MADTLLQTVTKFSDGCQGATPEQISNDIREMIILPTLKGEPTKIPEWILARERADVLTSATQYIGNTRERFTPLPFGILKISDYRASEFMERHGVSIFKQPAREPEEQRRGEWLAQSDSGIEARGRTPTDALNNLFMMSRAVGAENA
jgi:hypothetical protein